MNGRLRWTLVLAALGLSSCTASPAPYGARPARTARLENAHWLTDRVLCGAQPEGEAGFGELAALGVKTVVSVDGAKPDVEAARRSGMEYIHLPIGYDGIPADRALELAKLLQTARGPVYVHCHHGQHRAPAAAAVACIGAGLLDTEQALNVMKTMGTGPQYLGLWASAREAKRQDEATLRTLRVEFVSIAPVPPLAEAMVHLDDAFVHLEACRKAGWKKPADHPDLEPVHEALRAREICSEIMRTDLLTARPVDFREWMGSARNAAAELETRLGAAASKSESSRDAVDLAFENLRKSCTDCHRSFRNTVRKK